MIYITGDKHTDFRFVFNFCYEKETKLDDILIILGDSGINYHTNEREVLDNPGKVSHKVSESFALSEFEKYRIVQDKLFESDFDKFMIEMKNEEINN